MNQLRRGKALLIVIIALLVVLVLAVVFLPPILNALGVSRSVVLDLVAAKVTEEPDADRVHLTWFGPQTIEGLTVNESGGRKAMDVNVIIHKSLLPIVFSTYDDLEIDVSGAVSGTVREDGSISLTDLFATDEEKKEEEGMLAGVPGLGIDVDGLQLILDLPRASGSETLTITDLQGRLLYVPGGEGSVALESPTESGELRGSLAIKAESQGLFNRDGALTPSGAQFNANIELNSVPMPFEERVRSVRTLRLLARTDDLAEEIEIESSLETELTESDRPSQLEASLAMANPFASDGSFNFNPAALTGEVTGQAVPSALLQPLLADSPILLSRDVGPTVDLTARFSAGETRDIDLTLHADNLTVEGSAMVGEDRSISGRHFTVNATVQPALVAAMTERITIAQPAQLSIALQSFSVPPPNEDGGVPLGGVALTGTIGVSGPVLLTVVQAPEEEAEASGAGAEVHDTFSVGDLQIEMETDALSQGLRLAGSANVEEGRVEFAESVTGLVDDAGDFSLAAITPVGQLSITGVNASRITALLPAGVPSTAADSLLGASLESTVRTSRQEDGLRAEVAVNAERLTLDASLLRGADGTLQLSSGLATFTLTPELVSALQEDSEQPVQLTSPTEATLTLEPITLAGQTLNEYRLAEDQPLQGRLEAPSVDIMHSMLTEPVGFRDFVVDFTVALAEEMQIDAEGGARVLRPSGDQSVGQLAYDLQAKQVQNEWIPTGTIVVENFSVREVERLADLQGDPVTAWTGETGTLRISLAGTADRRELLVNSDMPNLAGDVRVTLADEIISATADELSVVLSQVALTSLLQRSDVEAETGAEPHAPPADRFQVAADMPLSVSVQAASLPMALLRGESFDPSAVRLDVTAQGGPLALQEQAGGLTTLRELNVDIETSNLSEGVRFTMTGDAQRDGEAAGEMSVSGSLANLVSETSTLELADASLNLDAEVTGVPTRLADALLGLDGLLVAAVGDQMDATFQSRAFSRNAGYVDLAISTTHGSLEGRLRGKDDSLRTTTDQPLHGELAVTPPLRQRLLQSVHPLLADVRTTEQPIRFEFTSPTTLPLDGDLGRMKGDFRITIGNVQFDSGSALLAFLALFEEAEGRESLPGSIEPVIASIRKGVLTYEQFAVHLGKYTLQYDGQIDLKTKEVQLRTSVPLEALAMTFKELEGYVEEITVPIVTVGELGNLETQIDPKFNLAEAAAKAGFKGVLEKELEDKGIPLGDILGDLLGGGKKKKEQEKPPAEEEEPEKKDEPNV